MRILLILQLRQTVLFIYPTLTLIHQLRKQNIIPQSALESKTKFCEFLFEEEKSIPREITDTVQQLHTTETNINTLDGNDSYTVVIN